MISTWTCIALCVSLAFVCSAGVPGSNPNGRADPAGGGNIMADWFSYAKPLSSREQRCLAHILRHHFEGPDAPQLQPPDEYRSCMALLEHPELDLREHGTALVGLLLWCEDTGNSLIESHRYNPAGLLCLSKFLASYILAAEDGRGKQVLLEALRTREYTNINSRNPDALRLLGDYDNAILGLVKCSIGSYFKNSRTSKNAPNFVALLLFQSRYDSAVMAQKFVQLVERMAFYHSLGVVEYATIDKTARVVIKYHILSQAQLVQVGMILLKLVAQTGCVEEASVFACSEMRAEMRGILERCEKHHGAEWADAAAIYHFIVRFVPEEVFENLDRLGRLVGYFIEKDQSWQRLKFLRNRGLQLSALPCRLLWYVFSELSRSSVYNEHMLRSELNALPLEKLTRIFELFFSYLTYKRIGLFIALLNNANRTELMTYFILNLSAYKRDNPVIYDSVRRALSWM
ncbi:hypothetical protein PAPHI01_1524 [Pancytospora philotis]|nr:hypothetical protein PAPHI01_1524 [Pancytospora philotis]